MCDVDRLAGVDAEDVLDAEAKRSEYLVTHVKNGDGLYALTLFRTSDTRGQVRLLEEAVTDTKVPRCPLLGVLKIAIEPEVPLAVPAPADNDGYGY